MKVKKKNYMNSTMLAKEEIMKTTEKNIQFEGIHNFRDMGGQVSENGLAVKYGLLYRCGELSHATATDLQMLEHLGIKTIFDYRDEEEAVKDVTPKINGATVIRIPARKASSSIQNASVEEMLKSTTLGIFDENILAPFYVELPIQNDSYKQLVKEMVNKNVPLIHHCTAGKDRTGVGAAILYLILGVSEEAIIAEYLKTNDALEQNPPHWHIEMKKQFQDSPIFAALAGCNEVFLRAALNKIKEVYGSFDCYIQEEFNITPEIREDLKAYYLEHPISL